MIQFVIAKESEAGVVSRLRQRVWSTVYRGVFPDEMIDRFDYEWHQQRDLARIQSDEYLVYRITADDQNIGYLIIKKGRPLLLQSLYILPAYQRQGIGKMAFQLIRDYCKHNGMDTFICHCQPRNASARAFYCKMGGKIIAQDVDNAEHWQDSVTFEFEV